MTPPLITAARNGHAETVRELLKAGADINQTVGSNNALRAAIAGGHGNVLRVLIENGARINEKLGGMTPLRFAHHIGREDMARQLRKVKSIKLD